MAGVIPLRPNADPLKLARAMEAVLRLRPGRPVEVPPADALVIIAILRDAAR